MASAAESVAVVVVTYHSERLLPDLIASLGPGLGELPWHLVVADNASGDGTVAALRRLAPQATVVQLGANRGYAAGINAAVAAAGRFTAILVLNPDVRLEPGCVPELVTTLRTPGTGIAAPRLVDGDGALIPSMRREPSVLRALGDALIGGRAGRVPLIGEIVTAEDRYSVPAETAWAEGSTLLISADCWRACGPWDESYFLYSEEADFALRARDAGFATRFTPAARAMHLGGDYGATPYLWVLLTLNRLRLYRRRHGRLRSAGFWGALLLREVSRAILGRPVSRAAARALLSPAAIRERPGPHLVNPPPSRASGNGSADRAGHGRAQRRRLARPTAPR